MLRINQQTKPGDTNYNIITDSNLFSVSINVETLDRDIARIEDQLKHAKNKCNIKNLQYILKYLNKTKKKIEDGEIRLCWSIKDNRLMSYPTEIKTHPEYKIDVSEYIELKNEKMITLDFIDIINIISFEYIYRDLGYTHEDIEKVLENLGITGTVPVDELVNFFASEDLEPYFLSKGSRIEDSPHINNETHKIKNYYDDEEFEANYYQEVVMDSVKATLDIIACNIYRRLFEVDKDVKLISIGETTIVFIINDKTDINIFDIIESMSLRAFGRNFEVVPKVTIL